MEGRFPPAVRLVWANCTSPALTAEFNRWYDQVHIPDLLASHLATHGLRYENAAPDAGEARYLTIWELDRTELGKLDEEFAGLRDRLTRRGRIHPALAVMARKIWQRIGPEFVTKRGVPDAVKGIWLIESTCIDAARDAEFNRWYDTMHIPDLLNTGVFTAAYRFIELDGRRYLAIYETATNPIDAVDQFVKVHRPRLRAQGRLSEIINVTQRATFRRLSRVK
jgi:hypothetical protein